MVAIENLSFTYPGASAPNLKKINLNIEKGDFLAIVGNNGCGKSTLCKTLNGLIPHFISGDMEGRIFIDGKETANMDIGSLAKKAGYVYQDFENQIVRPTVLDDVSFACLNFAYKDYEERGRKALKSCGLEQKTNDYVWQLSGGQKHLLALAGAAALGPDLLILDEPIAQLDPAHAKQIYEVLKELNENQGKTIIVIEHHTEFIADYCRHVVLMRDGEILWKKETKDALQQVEDLTKSNIYPPQVTIAAHRLRKNGFISKYDPLPITVEEGIASFSHLTFLEYAKDVEELHSPGEMAASFENVTVEYRSVKGEPYRAMENFNLEIRKGEKIALIGSNGAGKTTLLKMMTGLLKPTLGTVRLGNRDVRNMEMEELSKCVSLVYQNPEEMFIKDSILSDIEFAMKEREQIGYEKRAKELLAHFNLTDLEKRDGRLMSGGQMRRASLAIGVALNPSVLLLDEPTANLDIATRKDIMRTLHEMEAITETVIIATHDMQLVCDWADRIIVLCQGKVVADGSKNQVFGNKKVMEQAGIRPPEIYDMAKRMNHNANCYTIDDFCIHLKSNFLGGENEQKIIRKHIG